MNDEAAAEPIETLPLHTSVSEFEIMGVIGEGGFGTVYLAQDHSLRRQVALKEYCPAALATHKGGRTVTLRSQRHAEAFAAGLRNFINEAHTLAKFDHPALVKVYRFWKENDTAYIAMPLYEGRTLKEVVTTDPSIVTEDWLKSLLAPLLDAVEALHDVQIFHRDIAPDNILLLENGAPILLDFGAAREIIADATQAVTVILKPGYAPIEQYAEDATMKQGAWTDIYALAAVICFAITRQPPTNSVARVMSDKKALPEGAAQGYSPEFIAAIEAGLATRPEARPQSIAEFRRMLGVRTITPSSRGWTGSTYAPGVSPGPHTVTRTGTGGAGTRDPNATIAVMRKTKAPGSHAAKTDAPSTTTTTPKPQTIATSLPSKRRMAIIGVAVTVVVILLAAGIGWYRHEPSAPPASAPVAPSAPEAAKGVSREAAKGVSKEAAKGVSKEAAKDAAKEAATKPASGNLLLVIKPWGEVLIDGTSMGVSPPLKRLSLPEGKHMIEITNSSFPQYSAEIQVQKDKTLQISHQFK